MPATTRPVALVLAAVVATVTGSVLPARAEPPADAPPRKAGVTSRRWIECSRPSICRIVRPCTGSS
ncbi:hypothetical protein, partial [Actinoplanes philippinensis]|uniref:hypothetical protein n=1 Tax=Actinoplanes philippinensis TaxID=35752 RepID=UPI0033D48B8F